MAPARSSRSRSEKGEAPARPRADSRRKGPTRYEDYHSPSVRGSGSKGHQAYRSTNDYSPDLQKGTYGKKGSEKAPYGRMDSRERKGYGPPSKGGYKGKTSSEKGFGKPYKGHPRFDSRERKGYSSSKGYSSGKGSYSKEYYPSSKDSYYSDSYRSGPSKGYYNYSSYKGSKDKDSSYDPEIQSSYKGPGSSYKGGYKSSYDTSPKGSKYHYDKGSYSPDFDGKKGSKSIPGPFNDNKGKVKGTGKCTGFSVLVRNLDVESSPQDVNAFFSTCGKIRDVYLPLEFSAQTPRGFGFVEFMHHEDAMYAVREMDGRKMHGATLSVIMAQDRRKTPNTMQDRIGIQGSEKGSKDRRESCRSRSRSRSS